MMSSHDEGEPEKAPQSTYYARKLEIEQLQTQVATLSAHAKQLETARIAQCSHPMMQNALLRSGLQATDCTIAGVQSLLTHYSSTMARNPLSVQISLSADPEQRHQTLAALRIPRLHEAMAFLLERMRFVDLRRRHRQNEESDLANGDHAFISLHVEPLRSVSTVQQGYDRVMMALSQQEFTVGAELGLTMTFESDDAPDLSYSQTRGLLTTMDGLQVEKNMACFRLFSGGPDPFALLVFDPIDHDERYPYRPELRVRRDMTLAVMICPIPGERGIAVVHWQNIYTHKAQCPVTRRQERRVQEMLPRWTDILYSSIVDEY
ncbi:hypothetical protein Poli38472_012358 [Pythium oligandrum]|uniref:Uncharacterized protein n=1 Tax=Pythium oligandrum TaxID=41045 RepID=A0A8K1CRA2_PYTOL|nr:hypothetical protein Poli38472_012358 [Pythium oligandrum]|eukprot:TMW67242.1 hypothetical protein Poli38472_012358 [Pythium oligandrum]